MVETPLSSDKIIVSPKCYILQEDVYHKFYNDLGIREPFEQRDGWYKVFQDANGDWWLFLRAGFRWNGADCFPDYDYMLFPSAVHDPCLWLIDWGIIPESMNNRVDKELGDCVVHGKCPMPLWKGRNWKPARRLEAWKITRATHLARTEAGEKGSLEFLNRKVLI